MVDFVDYENSLNDNLIQEKHLVDLHIHSCYSDGEFTPNELIGLSRKNNVSIISITDHDTILGLKNIQYGFDDVKLISGIELSAKVDKGRMHILGYDIDINNLELNNKMNELRNNRINYVLSLIEQIKKDYGIIFNQEEVNFLIHSNHNVGRVDIAKLCIKYGYANTVKEAFSKYLIDSYNKIRHTIKILNYEECIELILNSEGIPVLAHPKTLEMNRKEMLILLKELIDVGLRGIEAYHSIHSQEDIDNYLEMANKFNLLVSGGSDFHGPAIKPDINIGTGKNNNIKIKNLSILNEIYNK